MSGLTIFLARLLGLFTIVGVAAMFWRGDAVVEAAVTNQPAMLSYGFISLGIGLAMVLGHNVWSGGLLPVVVTLLGWLILLKGLVLLLLAPDAMAHLYAQMRYGERYGFYLLPSFVIGVCLAWAGFTAGRR
jgi:hypothetical protein